MIKNINKLLLSEVLTLVNDDPSLLGQGQPFEFHRNSALHKVFYYGFVPSAKFKLPPGIPPYTPSDMQPGVNAVDLLIAIRRGRFSYFTDLNIPSARREQLFIELLETVYAEEAKVLLAIKDQSITRLYPNLTYKTLYQAGYLPYDANLCDPKSNGRVEKNSEINRQLSSISVNSTGAENPPVAKRGRGRPRKNAVVSPQTN